MVLFGLLFVPILMGLAGLVLGKGRVTLKEFAVQEAVVLVLIGAGYGIALYSQTVDTEIWNGVIAKKWEGTGSCCHSYNCNPHSCLCDDRGRNCSTCYDTCYEHASDTTWNASTSNGEIAFYDGCNRPGSSPPRRWNEIVIGEPTAIPHTYTNYIKGSPESVLPHTGAPEQFRTKIPEYPKVYDHYRVKRFLSVDVPIPRLADLDERLDGINAHLGSPKQVNLAVVVVNEADPLYLEALREAWLGGKKNDLVTVIGAPNFPEIHWTGVLSWTRNEEVKIAIRDRVMDLGSFKGDKVLDIIAQEVQEKFVRRPMADFEYIKSTIEPPTWACWLLFALGTVLSGILSVYFWNKDPFNSGNPFSDEGFRLGRNPFRRSYFQ